MHIVNPYRFEEAGPPPSNDFVMVVETTTPNETFTIPCQNVGVFNATVDWGDGFQSTITSFNDPDLTHTYANAGEHEIRINGSFPNILFNNGGDRTKPIDVPSLGDVGWLRIDRGFYGCFNVAAFGDGDLSGITSFYRAWFACASMVSFQATGLGAGTNFNQAWRGCSSLTSFPAVDLSSGTNFNEAWHGCSSLTSFPLVDLSAGTNFSSAWEGCSALTSFPAVDLSAGTDFTYAWYNCTALTSFPVIGLGATANFSHAWRRCTELVSFPAIDLSGGTGFGRAWFNCWALTSFPANMFDSCMATNFTEAFNGCSLDQTSVDNILVSIDTAGQSNGTLGIAGGQSSPPSAVGLAARSSLQGKGWTVAVNS